MFIKILSISYKEFPATPPSNTQNSTKFICTKKSSYKNLENQNKHVKIISEQRVLLCRNAHCLKVLSISS